MNTDDDFVFTYPVFFLLNPAPPVTFVSCPLESVGGNGVLVFTDEPAADDYLAANPPPDGVVKHPAQNEATFAAKVAILAEIDIFTHLIIDHRGIGHRPQRCVSISDLLRYFKAKGL